MENNRTAKIIAAILLFVVNFHLVTVISNEADILSKWNVRWWWPFGRNLDCPGLLWFANEQIRLEKGLLPADSILPPKKSGLERLHVYVVDQTTPDLYKTNQSGNFTDFNQKVESMCDTKFAFMQDARECRKIIKADSFHFHEAVGFYLLANSMAQNEKVKFCVLDYFGGEEAPFSCRIEEGGNIITCTKISRKRLCREFVLGPKNRPPDALKRSDFASLLTDFQGRMQKSIRAENTENLPIEVTFISDFIHEKEDSKGNGRYISIEEVKHKFSELLSACPEIKSLNLVKLPMRTNDSALEGDQEAMLMSFDERFKNGDNSPDFIPTDIIGESTECIKCLNIFGAENYTQTKPIRVFVPYNDGRFNDVGKGIFDVSAMEYAIQEFQLCLESPSTGELDMEITMPEVNRAFKVHVPQKPELVKVERPKSDLLTMSFTGVESFNKNTNPVLRVVTIKKMSTEELKFESICLPVRFMPRMSRLNAELIGYLTLTIMVGVLFLLMLFITNHPSWTKTNIILQFLLGALLLSGVSFYLMYRFLPIFSGRIPISVVVFIFTGIYGYFQSREHR